MSIHHFQTTQDNLNAALEVLNNLVSNQEFRPWELSDNVPRLKYDIASLTPQVNNKEEKTSTFGTSKFVAPDSNLMG